jgi:hypothetical protein
MVENKTQAMDQQPEAFLATIEDENRRADAFELLALMCEVTGEAAVMWGPAIIGFGRYHYRYKSGRESDWFSVGFSPRKASLTLYLAGGLEENADILRRLGKHKTGKGCLYITRLSDISRDALADLLRSTIAWAARTYPS